MKDSDAFAAIEYLMFDSWPPQMLYCVVQSDITDGRGFKCNKTQMYLRKQVVSLLSTVD